MYDNAVSLDFVGEYIQTNWEIAGCAQKKRW